MKDGGGPLRMCGQGAPIWEGRDVDDVEVRRACAYDGVPFGDRVAAAPTSAVAVAMRLY